MLLSLPLKPLLVQMLIEPSWSLQKRLLRESLGTKSFYNIHMQFLQTLHFNFRSSGPSHRNEQGVASQHLPCSRHQLRGRPTSAEVWADAQFDLSWATCNFLILVFPDSRIQLLPHRRAYTGHYRHWIQKSKTSKSRHNRLAKKATKNTYWHHGGCRPRPSQTAWPLWVATWPWRSCPSVSGSAPALRDRWSACLWWGMLRDRCCPGRCREIAGRDSRWHHPAPGFKKQDRQAPLHLHEWQWVIYTFVFRTPSALRQAWKEIITTKKNYSQKFLEDIRGNKVPMTQKQKAHAIAEYFFEKQWRPNDKPSGLDESKHQIYRAQISI